MLKNILITVAIILLLVIAALLPPDCDKPCVTERVNCKPALRGSWDHGPVVYPSLKCEERCQ